MKVMFYSERKFITLDVSSTNELDIEELFIKWVNENKLDITTCSWEKVS